MSRLPDPIVEDEVLVPETSLIQEQKILIEGLGSRPRSTFRLEIPVTLSAPTLDDPSPDLTRILWGIQKHGPLAEKIYAPLEVLRRIPECSATAAGT